jgi:hypothetical protein
MWVSNQPSGGGRELDKIAAVGDPTHVPQIDSGPDMSAANGQRGVAVQ